MGRNSESFNMTKNKVLNYYSPQPRTKPVETHYKISISLGHPNNNTLFRQTKYPLPPRSQGSLLPGSTERERERETGLSTGRRDNLGTRLYPLPPPLI